MSKTAEQNNNYKDICDFNINLYEKSLWTAALNSGEHNQTGALFNGDGYCCLGLYAKVKGCQFLMDTVIDGEGNVIEQHNGYTVEAPDGVDINHNEWLDQEFAETAGITAEHLSLQSHLNDGLDYVIADHMPTHALCVKLGFEHLPSEQNEHGTQFHLPKHVR